MGTEPTEMELRVARALWLDAGGESTPHDDGSCVIEDYIGRAHVAIRAMREPTGDMLSGRREPYQDALTWAALIDAASPEES